MTIGESPPYLITEPLLCSFTPQKLENGDMRMAIATVGQGAYNAKGKRKILSEKFLSTYYYTWENGLVSTNHENTNPFLGGAILKDLEYDSEQKLVIATFSNLPDKAQRLINSEFYQGVSQECIPELFSEDQTEVISGRGTGCTIVMWPHKPAATPEMGVGVRPAFASIQNELAGILASKYPTQIEESMSTNNGDGKAVISIETYEKAVSEKDELKSQKLALESENKGLREELASTKSEYEQYKSGETDRTNLAYSKGKTDGRAELVEENERLSAIEEFTQVHGNKEDDNKFVNSFLATNPSIEQIKVLTAGKKVDLSKQVGSSQGLPPGNEKSYEELNSVWNARLGRA